MGSKGGRDVGGVCMLSWSVSNHWNDVRGCCSFIEQSAAVMAAHRAGNCRRGATRPAIGIARRMQLGTGAAWLPRALWGASGLPWSSTANETELAHTSGNGCAPRERVCPQPLQRTSSCRVSASKDREECTHRRRGSADLWEPAFASVEVSRTRGHSVYDSQQYSGLEFLSHLSPLFI